MENIIFFYLLFISAINLNKCSNVLTFQLHYSNITLNNNISFIYNALSNTYIYSQMKIGKPEYSIKTLFSFNSPYFFMLSNYELINEANLLNNYDIENSETFHNISCLNQYYVQSNKDIHAEEKFIINMYNLDDKSNKEFIIDDLDFVLGVRNINQKKENLTKIYYMTIGLQFFTSQRYTQEKKINFISLIKQKKLVENYNWFIYYEKIKRNKEGLYNLDELVNTEKSLILGDFPHKFKPNEFHEEQLLNINSHYFLWILEFKSVYFYRNNTKFNTGLFKQEIYHNKAQLNFNHFIMYAPSLYITMIKNNFFESYISRNICHYYIYNQIESFYCEKSDNFNINDLKLFPTLYFEHFELNYTFEFTYEDLFFEKDNKYFFMVSSLFDVDDWFLGEIFFRKYQFVFNQDSKTISFYNINLDFEQKENSKKTIIINKSIDWKLIILIIILSSILFIGIGYIVGKNIYKKYKKKKRANELDDDYDYTSDKKILND